jgi:Fur family ferric uptake transcriptional regulator
MGGLEKHFEQRLRDRGLRATRERREILAHAFERFGHFRAGELYASLRHDGHRISRATVYRTITHLVETGLLRRHDLGDRRTLYEPVFGREHHEHMVCVRCGKIFEFVQREIERLQEEVCRKHGFRPLSHTLQIRGICGACRHTDSRFDPPVEGTPAHG